MRKTFLAISIFAGLMMTACQPETLNEQLGIPEGAILLTTEGFTGNGNGTKTSVSGTSVQWENEDALDIWCGSTKNSNVAVKVSEGKAYINSSLTGSGAIRAYYSTGTSSGSTDSPTVKIPASYECTVSDGRQVIALPMVGKAEAAASKIELKHITAAVNVVLKNSVGADLYVDEVDVISESYDLNSPYGFAIDLTKADLGVTTVAGTSKNTNKVTFSSPFFKVPEGSSDKSIQVPIRPIGEDHLTIKVYCHSASQNYVYMYRPESTVSGLARNEMLTAKVDLNTTGNLIAGSEVNLSTKSANFTATNGDIYYGTPGKSAITCTIPAGATITLGGVSATTTKMISFKAADDATIILAGTNTFNGGGAVITVAENKTLTIQGSGSLNITASSGAAIGSKSNSPCGNIIINGGTITARVTSSGSTAAAIGCGGNANCGNITINGGTVTASSDKGTGIGTSNYAGANTCGNITINGGTVVAVGASGAAGIGTGSRANADNACGTISIGSGVTSVTATKGAEAEASIGKGNASSTCGTVTIAEGANVTQN